jgi:5'-nucleotidase (lipoprotein e(P4) family)
MIKSKFFLLFGLMVNSYLWADGLSTYKPLTQDSSSYQAVKWYRSSAEKVAAYHQVYQLGLEYVKSHYPKHKPWGVVLDIDETTLDNSWAYVKYDGVGATDDEFSQYVVLPEKSVALPGVKNFTCQIKKMGGYVSLVSNRDGSYVKGDKNVLSATVANLKNQGICFDQVLLENLKQQKQQASNKNPRFQAISNGSCNSNAMVCSNTLPKHEVVAYFGDNIQDFPVLKQSELINAATDDARYQKFGQGYFMLPNPIYGSWGNNQLR